MLYISNYHVAYVLDTILEALDRAQDAASTQDVGSHLFKPRMNLHEDVEKNLVTATFELPGLTKDKVNIDFQNRLLTISGQVAESPEPEKGEYKIKERLSGKFSRTLQVPAGTQPDAIKASMENGVLTVKYPKLSTGQEPQRIMIN